MTSIKGFFNEEYELEKEFCQEKKKKCMIAKVDTTSLKAPWKQSLKLFGRKFNGL